MLGERCTTHQVAWLRGLKTQLGRKAVGNIVDSGGQLDHSAEPLFLEHIADIIRAYALVGRDV